MKRGVKNFTDQNISKRICCSNGFNEFERIAMGGNRMVLKGKADKKEGAIKPWKKP